MQGKFEVAHHRSRSCLSWINSSAIPSASACPAVRSRRWRRRTKLVGSRVSSDSPGFIVLATAHRLARTYFQRPTYLVRGILRHAKRLLGVLDEADNCHPSQRHSSPRSSPLCSSRNSGMVHAGLIGLALAGCNPGSDHKMHNCITLDSESLRTDLYTRGMCLLCDVGQMHNIPFGKVGKLVVAHQCSERSAPTRLHRETLCGSLAASDPHDSSLDRTDPAD